MQQFFLAYLVDDTGAITVDWVVLTAAIIGLGLLVLGPIAFNADSAARKFGEYVSGLEVGYGKND